MEQTSDELPNFSIGIDLLGPDPTNNKNQAEKNSQVARFANLSEDRVFDSKNIFSDTRVHLVLIFSIFPVNFELFHHSCRLTGSNVLAQTKP